MARAEGHNKWQTNSDENFSNLKFAAGQLPAEHDDCVSRLFKPQLPNTLAVIFKVKADIARRGLSMPEVVFIAPDHHPEALMKLVVKARELADQLANLGLYVVCSRTGDSYIIAGVNEE